MFSMNENKNGENNFIFRQNKYWLIIISHLHIIIFKVNYITSPLWLLK